MKKKTLREQYNTIISQVNTLNTLQFGGGTVNILRATECLIFSCMMLMCALQNLVLYRTLAIHCSKYIVGFEASTVNKYA